MKWITRERPKIDRIACPWLVTRFIDPEAKFLFARASEVLASAAESGAIPFDIPGAELSHEGELCSFDVFLRKYALHDAALCQLAVIVRGADTARLELAPEAPGLLAISLGLSALFADDHEVLSHGFVLYDALYAWCRECQGETHNWPPSDRHKVEGDKSQPTVDRPDAYLKALDPASRKSHARQPSWLDAVRRVIPRAAAYNVCEPGFLTKKKVSR